MKRGGTSQAYLRPEAWSDGASTISDPPAFNSSRGPIWRERGTRAPGAMR